MKIFPQETVQQRTMEQSIAVSMHTGRRKGRRSGEDFLPKQKPTIDLVRDVNSCILRVVRRVSCVLRAVPTKVTQPLTFARNLRRGGTRWFAGTLVKILQGHFQQLVFVQVRGELKETQHKRRSSAGITLGRARTGRFVWRELTDDRVERQISIPTCSDTLEDALALGEFVGLMERR